MCNLRAQQKLKATNQMDLKQLIIQMEDDEELSDSSDNEHRRGRVPQKIKNC